MASKKEQAFELFAQGKLPSDPEVLALGLKIDSAKKYYRLWVRQTGLEPAVLVKPEVAPTLVVEAPVRVTVGSLEIGTLFESRGKHYKKAKYIGENVVAVLLDIPTDCVPHFEVGFTPDTLVTPKIE